MAKIVHDIFTLRIHQWIRVIFDKSENTAQSFTMGVYEIFFLIFSIYIVSRKNY